MAEAHGDHHDGGGEHTERSSRSHGGGDTGHGAHAAASSSGRSLSPSKRRGGKDPHQVTMSLLTSSLFRGELEDLEVGS